MIRTATRSEMKLIRTLHRRKGRLDAGLFLAEGPRVVAELLESDIPVRLVVYAGDEVGSAASRELAERASAEGIVTRQAPADVIATLSDTVTPQGLLAVARIPRPGWHEIDLIRIVVLDAVQDPGNLGTVVRTAEAMTVGAVVCLDGTVDPWSPKAVRASAGSSFHIPIVCASWEEVRPRFDAEGVELWVADVAGEPYRRGDPTPPRVALVLGNEGRGVSPGLDEAARRRVSLELAGRVESLNVGVAGAVLMDRMFGESGGSD
jgi:TrmH family RNA methyltransferase